MLEQVAIAIKSQDYSTAATLLQPLLQQDRENPWVQLYLGQVLEGTENIQGAEEVYLKLLRFCNNTKVVWQARQGIDRLRKLQAKIESQIREEQKVSQAKAVQSNPAMGVLILEPMESEHKKKVVQEFAKIREIDVYSAHLQLPTRAWRLYSTGPLGKLELVKSALQKASIPCFCQEIKQIKSINIYQVHYFRGIAPEGIINYSNNGQSGTFSFEWSEVKTRVEGLLPLYDGSLLEFAQKNKSRQRQKSQDYVKVCDLHLPKQNIIIRLCDYNYKFNQGVNFAPKAESLEAIGHTSQENWQKLTHFITQRCSEIPVWDNFSTFGATAIEFKLMLQGIQPHLNLLRREETPWDAAFQLYSSLIYLKTNKMTT